MRIWYVPFPELDNRRVVAQHSEVHAIWSLVTKREKNWKEFGKPEHRLALWDVHERSVEEMAVRGYHNHQTPLEQPLTTIQQLPVVGSDFVLERERWQLVCRNGGQYLGRPEAMHVDYPRLIAKYDREGCQHGYDNYLGDIMVNNQKATLCLTCKRAYRNRNEESWNDLRKTK